MADRMRSDPARSTFLRDSRRRSWIVVCPATEFVVRAVAERRAPHPSFSPYATFAPRSLRAGSPSRLNSTDALVLTLICGFYGSLVYCLASLIR
ncbi:MAG TPA: hypothetical protein VKG44_07605 [Candidatus Baltobacteraceae bacterium]|nr:hypothetical protein [Candidatus Baltobacteraceae bacterium]